MSQLTEGHRIDQLLEDERPVGENCVLRKSPGRSRAIPTIEYLKRALVSSVFICRMINSPMNATLGSISRSLSSLVFISGVRDFESSTEHLTATESRPYFLAWQTWKNLRLTHAGWSAGVTYFNSTCIPRILFYSNPHDPVSSGICVQLCPNVLWGIQKPNSQYIQSWNRKQSSPQLEVYALGGRGDRKTTNYDASAPENVLCSVINNVLFV